mmetsp:Transcript_29355/g.113714  ORF Transcript_29355/g.113714 Transcript_29355/m.113714 type:complete len:128 (-) Transcript_29355:546-929(-)
MVGGSVGVFRFCSVRTFLSTATNVFGVQAVDGRGLNRLRMSSRLARLQKGRLLSISSSSKEGENKAFKPVCCGNNCGSDCVLLQEDKVDSDASLHASLNAFAELEKKLSRDRNDTRDRDGKSSSSVT